MTRADIAGLLRSERIFLAARDVAEIEYRKHAAAGVSVGGSVTAATRAALDVAIGAIYDRAAVLPQEAGVSGPQEQGTGDPQRQPGAPQPTPPSEAAPRPTRDEVKAALTFAAPDYLTVEDLRKMLDAVGAVRGWRE